MDGNIVIVHTAHGRRYAQHIASSIRWIGQPDANIWLVPADREAINQTLHGLDPNETIIHARAANPEASFMNALVVAEKRGYTVVNNTTALILTSDKGKCCKMLLATGLPHPVTFVLPKEPVSGDFYRTHKFLQEEFVVIKPTISQGQGKFVKKIRAVSLLSKDWWDGIPGDGVVVQELVDYAAIYRVIVIGGKALPYAFVDKPEYHPDEWKVSVCLNKNQKFEPDPYPGILRLAEEAQRAVGGEINFVDIFTKTSGGYTMSEINTACNLRIHELLAKKAGHPRWNIHYRIARHLLRLLEEA